MRFLKGKARGKKKQDADPQKACWDKKYTSNSCHKVFCEPWRRCVDGRCICKLPYQCPKNIGIALCSETDRTFNNYCQLKSSECSNPIHRAASKIPCGGKFNLLIKKKNGNTTNNDGLLKIKLPSQEQELFVCSEHFSIREANVACRHLGHALGAVVPLSPVPIKMKNQNTECLHITCRGTETTLAECVIKKGRSSRDERARANCQRNVETCSSEQFTCVNAKCIPSRNICDGENDCGDLSDEMCCSECKSGFHCKSDVCIPEHYVCNGERDCLTGEDEAYCKDKQPEQPKDKQPEQLKDAEKTNGDQTETTDGSNAGRGVSTENGAQESENVGIDDNGSNDGQPNKEPEIAGDEVLVDAVDFNLSAERKLIMDHLPQLNCGIPKNKTEHTRVKRIVGGERATPHQFPWQVAIKEGGKVNCGGIYLGGCWVLTAAHCVRPDQPQKYFITIDMLDRLSQTERVDTFPVKSVKVHENYASSTYENDIALLEVVNIYKDPSCMQVDNNLVPACVPWSPHQFKAGDTCVVSGWGREEGFGKVFHLKWGNITLMNNCSEVYKNRFFENMECAGTYDGSIDACKGDSGGPLVCFDAYNVAYVWGIVSWGENCGLPGYPGVYTKVANYFEWISRQMGREGRALITKFNT